MNLVSLFNLSCIKHRIFKILRVPWANDFLKIFDALYGVFFKKIRKVFNRGNYLREETRFYFALMIKGQQRFCHGKELYYI